MTNGWIMLHRSLIDSDFWLSEKFTKAQAWVDLILNANHKDGSFWVRGIEVEVKRGQLGWSEVTMAKRWKWSRGKVRLFLNWLAKDQKIVQQKRQQITTIISLINYEKYQTDVQQKRQQTVQQKDNRLYINNNDNNVKNDNKEIYIKILSLFNDVTKKKFKVLDEKAVDYWITIHPIEEIENAIRNIPSDDFWKDKMTPTILFRRKNQNGEAVDYIDQLNKKILTEEELLHEAAIALGFPINKFHLTAPNAKP